MKPINYPKLIAAIAISQAAGFIGAIFTTSAVPTWYATLTKPALSPPNWVFGPVWTTLYLLMGIAAYLIWQHGLTQKATKIALSLFLIQLILNSLWSILFFGTQNPQAALVEIIILWVAILATIIAFAKISKPAAWLLVPYLLWVSFASYLNYAITALN